MEVGKSMEVDWKYHGNSMEVRHVEISRKLELWRKKRGNSTEAGKIYGIKVELGNSMEVVWKWH